MCNDFYMFYRMRTNMTLSVKAPEVSVDPYYVKVVISDDEKSFEKVAIIREYAATPDRAINGVMRSLLDIEEQELMRLSTATEKELLNWDKL